MIIFQIILAIISFMGMFGLVGIMDKKECCNTTFNTMCIGGIACCGIILGLCLGLLFS